MTLSAQADELLWSYLPLKMYVNSNIPTESNFSWNILPHGIATSDFWTGISNEGISVTCNSELHSIIGDWLELNIMHLIAGGLILVHEFTPKKRWLILYVKMNWFLCISLKLQNGWAHFANFCFEMFVEVRIFYFPIKTVRNCLTTNECLCFVIIVTQFTKHLTINRYVFSLFALFK